MGRTLVISLATLSPSFATSLLGPLATLLEFEFLQRCGKLSHITSLLRELLSAETNLEALRKQLKNYTT
jgi:hypothetical protein